MISVAATEPRFAERGRCPQVQGDVGRREFHGRKVGHGRAVPGDRCGKATQDGVHVLDGRGRHRPHGGDRLLDGRERAVGGRQGAAGASGAGPGVAAASAQQEEGARKYRASPGETGEQPRRGG